MTDNEQVFKTLAWADALDMPLSLMEVRQWLVRQEVVTTNDQRPTINDKSELGEVAKALDELVAKRKIDTKWGFYFLAGEEKLVAQRAMRLKIADEKWKMLVRITQWLRFIPFLRAVFASGSLALSNTDNDSDLDVFLVTAPGRIFTARLFVIVVLKLLGRYRSGVHIANHICPNHYITENSLEIPFHSLYTAHQYASFVRVWSKESLALEKFWQANSWIGEYMALLNGMLGTSNAMRRTMNDPPFIRIIRGGVEVILQTPFGDALERAARKVELSRIAANPLTKNPGSGHVVANNQMLAFHPNSPEQALLTKFRASAIYSTDHSKE